MSATDNSIFAIEGIWDEHGIMTINPLLNLITQEFGTVTSKFTFRNFVDFSRFMSYIINEDIIYIASHGKPGFLKNGYHDEDPMSLNKIAELIGKRGEGKVIHISACSTLRVDRQDLDNFKRVTGCRSLSGYSLDADWIESAAMDLLYLNYLVSKSDMSDFINDYPDLKKATGFILI